MVACLEMKTDETVAFVFEAYPTWLKSLLAQGECRSLPAVRRALKSLNKLHRLACTVLSKRACRLNLNGGLIEVSGDHCRRLLADWATEFFPAEWQVSTAGSWPACLNNQPGPLPADDYRHIKEAEVVLKQLRQQMKLAGDDHVAGDPGRQKKDGIMSISDSLVTAHENLLRVIPKPLTADEDAERVRTSGLLLNINPAALHDAARRFVDALSTDPAAAAELQRRGTLCATLTGEGSEYFIAKTNAQRAVSEWNLAGLFAEQPVYLDFLQGNVRSLLQAAGEELIAAVRGKYEQINRLLAVNEVPEATRALLEACAMRHGR